MLNKQAKKLYNSNWKLCHSIVDERDGHKCVICGETENLQLDHCITRGRKSVFFETALLNYLCPKCHTTKSFQHGCPLDKKVDLITQKRIGKKQWEKLIQNAEKLCPSFSTIFWQEAENERLKEELEMTKAVEDVRGWTS